MNKDEMIRAQAQDKIEQCFNKNFLTNTQFLDSHQQSILRRMTSRQNPGCNVIFYGGYRDAERVMMVCIPEYLSEKDIDILKVIRVKKKPGGKSPSHSDYLGSLLGLGIKREMTGDILVREDGADIIVMKEIAYFIGQNYAKVGRKEISNEIVDIDELLVPEREEKHISDTVASLRLDNIVSSAFSMSRTKAAAGIRGGSVYVNHMEVLDLDFQIKEGDLINFRKKGRARLIEIGGKSKKNRIRITFSV